MNWNQSSRWLSLFVLVVGCNAKLQVDPGAAGAGGVGGAKDVGGASAGSEHGGGTGNWGGALVMGPLLGHRGQDCIPGETATEAEGNPGKTLIVTLDRCNDGLTCDATKHCTSIPDCPQPTGVCVVYGTPVDPAPEAGSSGGAAGSAGSGSSAAGSNSGPGNTAPESGIVQLAVDDSHLYWLEYGTRDSLGNYQHDGALRAYELASAKTTTLAADLPGPVTLGITSGHAYVGVDGGGLIGAPALPQLLRVPLSGGASEVVQDSIRSLSFAVAGDQAFWSSGDAIYTVTPSGMATPVQIHTSQFIAQLQADSTDLYYEEMTNNSWIISRLPQTTTNYAATQVVPQSYFFGLGGDSVYGVEWLQGLQDSMILDRVPKTGGAWTRAVPLGEGLPTLVEIIADRYFIGEVANFSSDSGTNSRKAMMLTGLLSSNAPPVRLVETSVSPNLNWQATAKAVFWSDGNAIFSRPVTDN